jgi:amino acid adenylation domain-containing protein
MRVINDSYQLTTAAHQNIKERDYWLKRLSGNPVKTGFRYDFEESEDARPEMEKVAFKLTGDIYGGLTALSTGSDYSLHVILTSVLMILLQKYSGRQDILVGSPIYKQPEDVELINTALVLRNRLHPHMSVKELLLEIRQTVTEASENQDYPIRLLPEQLNITDPGNGYPLFDVVLLLENIHDPAYVQDFDHSMLFSFSRTDGLIEGGVEYNTLRYKKESVQRIIGHFTRIIETILVDVNVRLGEIDLLNEPERREVLCDFNNTHMAYPAEGTIRQLWEARVVQTPHRIAIVGEGLTSLPAGFSPTAMKPAVHQLSYRMLNEKANRLSHFLRSRGVGANTMVGILLPPGVDMMIVIFGVLKAGGAYLPIDPDIPTARVATMLEESGAAILLTGSRLLSERSFTALQGQTVVGIQPRVTAPRQRITNMDALPMPDRSLVDYRKYNRYIGYAGVKHTISLEATRGCPYRCSYCHKIFPNKQVSRSADNIFAEVKYYYDLGVRRFSIIDDIFNLDIKNSSRFFESIIKNGMKAHLYFCAGLRGDILREDYIDLMVEAGTVSMSPALETASPRLQKLIGKNLNIPRFRRNIEYICEKYPQVILELFIMHGFPTETEEEARLTLDFVRSLKWVHFPYINILRIYSTTRMARFAVENGISYESIIRSEDLAWHELPETLPFARGFTLKYQTEFLDDYFLNRERLLHVLPFQMRLMTEGELIEKYNSYLPVNIDSFARLLEYAGIGRDELGQEDFLAEEEMAVPDLNEKLRANSPFAPPAADALRVLLLDLNLYFSTEANMLYDLVDEPLGLMRLLTQLRGHFGDRIHGRIAKSRIDFDNYGELRALLDRFRPDVIGIRTLTFYRDFVHHTISLIRQWGVGVPVVLGGPHVTTNYPEVLQDRNVDAAVLGEGELTFMELIGKILEHEGNWPGEEVLERIAGLAYLPGGPGKRQGAREIVMMDEAGAVLSAQPTADPLDTNRPGDLSYCIFTSGTTGRPKGVLVSHGNVVANLFAFYREFDIKPSDTVIQLSSYAFDAFVEEVYPVLLRGGKVAVPATREIMDIHLLSDFILRHRVDIIDCTPLLLNELNKLACIGNVHTFISGGDVLKGSYVDRLATAGRVYNTYGPTETTVCVTYYRYNGEKGAVIPIGSPIANYRVYIMADDLRPLPVGAAGEICVSGPAVTRGYLNKPELTAEKFVNLAAKAREGTRSSKDEILTPKSQILYRTGDLGRFLPDGNIEYLGRKDHQVKIRGFRIETAEIERLLLRKTGIKEAVVAARQGKGGDKYLCAYYVPDNRRVSPQVPEASELREYLQRDLPEYMIPTFFMLVDRLPLTPGGKVDRQALPEPEVKGLVEYEAPNDEIEEKLVAIWSEVLGVDGLGIHDNFFELGGHSLLAMRAASISKEVFGVKLSLADLFEIGTVKGVAEKIKKLRSAGPTVLTAPEETPRRKGWIQPFNLNQAPLMRASVVQLQPHRHLLFIDMHHIISDWDSMEIFAGEFVRLYTNQELSELRLQYKDFARWQGSFIESDEYQNQERYWLDCFSGPLPRLDLPLDFPRPRVRGRQGKKIVVDVGRELARRAKTFAADQQVTLFMLLLAVYNIVLARYGGREDIVVGIPVSGRSHVHMAPLIGMFVNTLALRNFPRRKWTFLEFLRDLRERTLSALENQDYQFEMLVEKLNIAGGMNRNPLFDTFFTVENVYRQDFDSGIHGLTVVPHDPGYSSAMFDLTVAAVITPDNIRLRLVYDLDLFKESTIARLARHLVNILAEVALYPGRAIGCLDMEMPVESGEPDRREREVSPDHRQAEELQPQAEWNDTAAEYPGDRTLDQLFEEQVQRSPDGIALIFEGQQVSYRELDLRANRVAGLLLAAGVGPGSCVALLVPRSLPMAYGLLGILKTGAAYVPVEPRFPQNRIQYILTDSRPAALLTTRSLSGRVKGLENWQGAVCVLEDAQGGRGGRHSARPAFPSSNPCYVIYTSGSTGRPKGVLIEHRQVVNTLCYRKAQYRMDAARTFLQLFSFAFDGFVTSFFTPLISGSRVVFLSDEAAVDVARIRETIVKERVSHFISVPTLYRQIIDSLEGEEASGLKVVTLAGDRLTPALLSRTREKNESIEIVNEYGVTEVSVLSTLYRHQEGDQTIKIGRPIWNTRVFIVDSRHRVLPVGAAGEMCISGSGVSRGYLNNPELTADRFMNLAAKSREDTRSSKDEILNPKSQILYRTGDLARFLPDGCIEYLGRLDHQVKVRGFRLELGEIEAVLSEHPAVRAAAVVDRLEPAGTKYLAAYVVADRDFTVKALRSYLLKELPEYMVPTLFYKVTQMPLTAGGKIDRKALAASTASRLAAGDEYVPPGSELERKLAEIWSEVLMTERVGMGGNFFDLGGDSLKANLVAALVDRELNVRVSVKEIFSAGTIAEFSRAISRCQESLAPIVAIEKREYYRPSSVQKRQYVLHQLNPGDVSYNLPIALTLEGYFDGYRLKQAFKRLIRRHESLRTDFRDVAGEVVQRVGDSLPFELGFYKADSKGVQTGKEHIDRLIKGDVPLLPLREVYQSLMPVEEREYYELSSAQVRLFLLDQFEDIGTSYNAIFAYNVEGEIDRQRLAEVCRTLIRRHQGLRASFVLLDNRPVQRIHESVDFKIEYVEAFDGPLSTLVSQFIRPFDLTEAPLLRVELISLSKSAYLLLFDLHHIICDGTSTAVLFKEFTRLYEGDRLPPLRLQYKDFTLWQNRMFLSGRIEEQEAYWLELFAGEIPTLNLPGDYPRPPIFDYEGDVVKFRLERDDTAAFRALTMESGATLYMNLMTAFNVLLYRYTGQDDIIVGSGIAGRQHPELHPIIGMFVNSLVLRNHPKDEKDYRGFLREVRDTCLEAFENQDLQFEELVERLNPERDPSRNPIFDALFVVQNFEQPRVELSRATFTPYEYEHNTSKFDLTLFAWEGEDEIYFDIEYYTRLFKHETIERMARHFVNILRQAARHPGTLISNIDLLTEEEKHRLLYRFNDTVTDYPKERTIRQLFEEQVDLVGDKIAVVFEDQSVTYRQLDEQANQLAAYLYAAQQIRPDDRVGIMMGRGLDRIAAVLAVLKAGGAYVPIDPSFPEERIKDMIDDARIGVVISRALYIKTLNRLQWECDSFAAFLCMDTENVYAEEEVEKSELMGKKLWEYVGETATDEVTGGGWLSSYTGEPIPRAEMDEYGDNILQKLNPLLHREMRVLEIGCASGITMYRIAPRVGFYYGTDLSSVIIDKNRQRIAREGHRHITLACLPAHRIDEIGQKDFDLVIINSVIQCFHGHNYLRRVIGKAVGLLKEQGVLFIGDIMDQALKPALVAELTAFKQANRDRSYKTKTDWSTELFVSREFFQDLTVEMPLIRRVDFSDKIYTIENELTRFRYDALLVVDKRRQVGERREKYKYQHDARVLAGYGRGRLASAAGPHHLAYVMYTSGSSGKQKGVMVVQRNVVRLVKHTDYVEFNEGDRILQTGALEFDASTFEIWGGLLNGLRLYLVGKETLLTPGSLKQAIRRYKISIMWMTSPLFNQMLDEDMGIFAGLRTLLVGGDVLSPLHIKRLRQRYPHIQVINGYGPTENTTFSTTFLIEREYGDSIPIGRPIANSTAYIVDRCGRQQPIGVAGELWVGGDGVSRGYLNNPELTAERFVNFNLAAKSREGTRSSKDEILTPKSQILYRTGDLCRFLPDGNIEFIGRADFQVKIRGFRLELGEIENQLLKHEAIKEAVVLVRTEPNGEKSLAAYLVADGDIDIPALREYLSRTLPDFMIPAYFVELDKIPLNPNGKVDRRALPEPESRLTAADNAIPADQLEAQLVEIWSQVLGIESGRLSTDADFFEIGGHSLKATILLSKIHKELNVKVPLAEIFRTPTVRELAKYIMESTVDPYASIQPVEKKEYYPLSSAQERIYVLQQVDVESTAYNTPLVMKLEAEIDRVKLEGVFRQLIRRHESFRTAFGVIGGEPVQRIHREVDFGLEFQDSGDEKLESHSELSAFISRLVRPFDLAGAPLLRVVLAKLSAKEYVMMVDVHHIITDGTANIILRQEFAALYEGLRLPPLRIQYKDYSVWQNRADIKEMVASQRDFWLRELKKGKLPVSNLPLDFERPQFLTFSGKRLSFEMPGCLTKGLRQMALRADASIFMVLLSVFEVFLSRICGQEEVVVGTPIAGRGHHDLQYIVGMFVNTLVLKNRCSGDKTFADFLDDVRERTLAAFDNQDYQFDDLVNDLSGERRPGRNPLFDVMFVLQNMEIQPGMIPKATLTGLEVKPFDYRQSRSAFDLIFMGYEEGEGLGFFVDFNTRLFRQEKVERFIEYFKEVAARVVENPDVKLKEISLSHDLSETNKRLLREDEGDFAF